LPDETGPFQLCTPTIGAPNAAFIDPDPILFDAFNPVHVTFGIDDAGIAALRADPRTYVPATFTLTQGTQSFGPITVGVALKGSLAGTFRTIDERAAFKVKFDKFVPKQRFLGLTELKLNNMNEDRSLVHENLGYRMLAAAGIPAGRAGYAVVDTVTDGVTTSYGFHATIEALDADWASLHFAQAPQHIYEGDGNTDIVPGAEPLFNITMGSKTNLADVIALEQVSQASDADFFAQLSANMDIPNAAKAWMGAQYIAHWDGYCGAANNFYFFDGADGKFSFISSGIDEALDPAFAGLAQSYDVKTGQSPFANQGILFHRCVADASCSAALDAALLEIAPGLQSFDAVGLFDQLVAFVEPFAESDAVLPGVGRLEFPLDDTNPADVPSFPGVHQVQQQTRDFLVARPAILP
jgi:hypothetical protein